MRNNDTQNWGAGVVHHWLSFTFTYLFTVWMENPSINQTSSQGYFNLSDNTVLQWKPPNIRNITQIDDCRRDPNRRRFLNPHLKHKHPHRHTHTRVFWAKTLVFQVNPSWSRFQWSIFPYFLHCQWDMEVIGYAFETWKWYMLKCICVFIRSLVQYFERDRVSSMLKDTIFFDVFILISLSVANVSWNYSAVRLLL